MTRTIRITTPGTVINCEHVEGMIDVEAPNFTIKNSIVVANSGKTGIAANGSGAIKIEDGASAVVDHVKINGDRGVMACVWDQGTSEVVEAVNCFGSDDGIWSWADMGYSHTTGDHFVIRDSYIHDLTTRTSNGHEDGFQTEGASYGVIEHNTVRMTTIADSALAIWDSLKSSHDILVKDNLLTGGGFAIYAEDYNPGDGSSPNFRATGGFSVTGIRYRGQLVQHAGLRLCRRVRGVVRAALAAVRRRPDRWLAPAWQPGAGDRAGRGQREPVRSRAELRLTSGRRSVNRRVPSGRLSGVFPLVSGRLPGGCWASSRRLPVGFCRASWA